MLSKFPRLLIDISLFIRKAGPLAGIVGSLFYSVTLTNKVVLIRASSLKNVKESLKAFPKSL